MKPVAWANGKHVFLDEACDQQYRDAAKPLYFECPADQLREAQVKVLQEAAEMIRCKRNVGDVFRAEAELIRVADELEKADAIRGLA